MRPAAVGDVLNRERRTRNGPKQESRRDQQRGSHAGLSREDEGVAGLARSCNQLTRVASSVMLALRSLETGQPALALAASSSKVFWSAPGTLAFKTRWTVVMAQPPSTCSRVTSADVSICSAVSFA